MSSPIVIYKSILEWGRLKTLTTLDEIAKRPDAAAVLGFRPGPGRAHIAWQFLHIAITEELYGTERIGLQPTKYPELLPRFRGGSVPDEDIPSAEYIRAVLVDTRQRMLGAIEKLTEADMPIILPFFKERGWTTQRALDVICWHEGHHQGQAHITLNLWKAAHP